MIPKYRKKPVVIDAFVLTRNYPEHPDKPFYVEIRSLEGLVTAEEGNYIIRVVKGELYVCDPEIFKLTYEDADL